MSAVDVIVVGAGPAGSTCARHLARSGLAVTIVDKDPSPRYKTCGGGLIGRARRLIECDLAPVIERECRAAEMSLAGVSFRVERDEPLVSMTMRAELDQRLLDAALSDGAELRAPCELRGLRSVRGGVALQTTLGELRARYAVAADGALSPTARAAGWPEHRRGVPAIESEIRIDPTSFERFSGSARFDFGVPATGYAWVFPKREHLSVGCLSTMRGERRLRDRLTRYLSDIGLSRIDSREDHGFVIPLTPRSRVLVRDRVLLIGDAAGFADPVTCEGISHALVSGRAAARSIAAGAEQPAAVYRAYHSEIAREILPELKLARFLAGIIYRRKRLRSALFGRLGQNICELMADIISGRQGYGDVLYRPRNYFRALALAARG